jgi:hypothetical protein
VTERLYYEARLFCTRCGTPVRVSSTFPIDPELYVCGECMNPVTADPTERQLALSVEREERLDDYDPTMAEIPF